MRELKPCPFCGSKAAIGKARFGEYVYCPHCHISQLIPDWNERPSEKITAEMSELLKHYCEVIEEYVSIYDNFPEDLQEVATQARELLEQVEQEEEEDE